MMLDKIAAFLDHILNAFIVIICLFVILIGSYTFYDRLIHGEIYNGSSLPANRNEGYKDQIGWIRIDDTNINYPVLQGKDNVEYLDKNPDGESDLNGSIFLEWSNDRQLKDEFSIIYGQHLTAEKMFGDLDCFLDKVFLTDIKTVRFPFMIINTVSGYLRSIRRKPAMVLSTIRH